MKTIAVITMHAVKNYGSVLQTLATQRLFELHGLQSIIIDYRRPWDTGISYYFDVKNKGIKDIVKQFVYLPSKVKQKIIFGDFISQHIKLTNYAYRNTNDFEKYPCEADIYCTGSDQVWNSSWNRGIKEVFYLPFVPDNKKKIAYASSIGKETIDDQEKSIIKHYLSSYDAISVRERSSVELLEAMGLKDVTLVLDPTLQLSKDEWNRLLKIDAPSEKNYVLIIQLNRNKQFDDFAVKFAKKCGKKLLRLCLRIDQAVLPGKAIVIPEVVEYLQYIAYADCVLTDSFHAVSFCLNYGINFYAVLPEKFATRIKSILSDLNLTDRIIQDYSLAKDQMNDIDYEEVNGLIQILREQSEAFLERICSAM